MDNFQLPDDFPRDGPFYSISGNQPKYVARRIGDRFVIGCTPKEMCERYKFCTDITQQLGDYAKRKSAESPDRTHAAIIERISEGLAEIACSERWGMTPEEHAWVMSRVIKQLNW